MSSQKRLCSGAQENDWQGDSDDISEFSDDSESSCSRNGALLRGDATPIKTGRQLYSTSVQNSTTKSYHNNTSVNVTPNAKRGGVVSHSQYDESCSQPPLGGSSDLCQLDLVAEALADVNRKRNAPPSDRRRRRGIIEKRRRERINSCLNDLRSLVPSIALKQNSAKCEKAEILQLTVEYLKDVSAGQLGAKADSGSQGATRRPLDYRSTGFRECLNEVAAYLNMQEGRPESDPLVVRLLNHLECVALQQSRADAAATSPSSRPDATNADTSANSTKQESMADSRADERERPAKAKGRKREPKSNAKVTASPTEISAHTPLSSRHAMGPSTPSVSAPNNSNDNYMLPHIETTITLSGTITPCTTSAARNATANRQPPIAQSGLTAGSAWHGRDHVTHPAQSMANELDTPPHPLNSHFLAPNQVQSSAQSQCLASNYQLSQFCSSQSHTACPSWTASPDSSSFAGLSVDLLSSTNSNASFIDAGSLLPWLGDAATPSSAGAGSNTGTNIAVPQSKDSNNNAAHAQHASATGGQTVPQPGLMAQTHLLPSFSNKSFSLPTNPASFGVPFPVGGGSSGDSVDGKSACQDIKPSVDTKAGSQTPNSLNVPPWLNSMLGPHPGAPNSGAPNPGGTLVELMPTPNGYYRIVGQYPVGLANAFNMPMSVPLPMSLPMSMSVMHPDVQTSNNSSGNSVYLPMSVQLGAPPPGHLHAPQRQSTPPQPPPAHSQAPPRTAQSAVLGPPSARSMGAHSQSGTQAQPQPTFMPLGPTQPQFTRLLDRNENLLNAGLQQPVNTAAQNTGELGVSASGEDMFASFGAMYHAHAHGHSHVMVSAPNTAANQQNVPNTCDSVMR